MSEALQKVITAFDDFLNEPPDYEDKYRVRDYRHSAYAKWSDLRNQITAALSPPEPTERQVEAAARAIWDVYYGTPEIFDRCVVRGWGDTGETKFMFEHVFKAARAALGAMPLQDHAAAFAALEQECWSLKCIDLPTGAGDADIGWEVVSHHMAKPQERREGFGSSPLEAIQNALSSRPAMVAEQQTEAKS